MSEKKVKIDEPERDEEIKNEIVRRRKNELEITVLPAIKSIWWKINFPTQHKQHRNLKLEDLLTFGFISVESCRWGLSLEWEEWNRKWKSILRILLLSNWIISKSRLSGRAHSIPVKIYELYFCSPVRRERKTQKNFLIVSTIDLGIFSRGSLILIGWMNISLHKTIPIAPQSTINPTIQFGALFENSLRRKENEIDFFPTFITRLYRKWSFFPHPHGIL